MAKISYIDSNAEAPQRVSAQIPTDESICAFLFDTSGFDNPFAEHPLLYNNFKDARVNRITNMDDASLIGIVNDGFMNGVLFYHLNQYFEFVGGDKETYIMITDCSQNWDSLFYLHQQTNGREFQIGIWTTQPIWRKKSDETIGFTSLITDLQLQADDINGKIGTSTATLTPINIILNGNSSYVDGNDFSYKQIPDAIELNCPKVSVLLLQNGTAEIKKMQENNPLHATVGALGFVMGCLSLCGAEESIASLEKCDLNKNETFTTPQLAVGKNNVSILNGGINSVWANILSQKGYIIPVEYEGIEASYYLSSDQTLSAGSFSTIANNRVMHKCRRGMGTALIGYINSNHIYDFANKNINATSLSIITGSIYTVLDSIMTNRAGQKQINSRTVSFLESEDLLESDSLALTLSIEPVNSNVTLTETVSHDNI